MKKKRITIKDRMKEIQEENTYRKKLNIEDENKKIVIQKKSKFIEFLIFLRNTLIKLLKFLFLLFVTVLSTIGLTVLINEPTRTQFIDLFLQAFN